MLDIFFGSNKKTEMVTEQDALTGREQKMSVPIKHYVFERPLLDDEGKLNCPQGYEKAMFGLGCFWGAERKFWQLQGTYITAVGYAAGFTPNPTYEEVCTGMTGHNEVVILSYDPTIISYKDLLVTFFESHNPTQGMRQGNDKGTQYRSGIYTYSDIQKRQALEVKQYYEKMLLEKGFDEITTEIIDAPAFYFAEGYHQQYLAKNPNGYCGLGGTGVSCSIDKS